MYRLKKSFALGIDHAHHEPPVTSHQPLVTGSSSKYEENIAGDKMLTKTAADKKEEAIADGKGVYTEWTFTKDYEGRERQIHAYVKDVIAQASKALGAEATVTRFARLKVGETNV